MTQSLADHPSSTDVPRTRIAGARNVIVEWVWIFPCIAVLYYPWALKLFHDSVATNQHVTAAALIYLGTAYLVPLFAFYVLYNLSQRDDMAARTALARRMSHLAFAAPPAYVLVGVLLYMMKIYGHDIAVWTGLWITIAALGALLAQTTPQRLVVLDDPRLHAPVRVAHGISALFILGVFLAPHLFNHLFGILGPDAHKSIMKVLEVVYRQHIVEPLLVVAFIFQIISGLVLLRPKMVRKGDLLDSVQTASGMFLTFFIASHINAVFVLARYFGTETNYAWATGLPAGLIKDEWNIRLLPHYSMAVFLVICHVACGLRVVTRTHGMPVARSNMIAWGIVGIGGVVTAVVTAGLVGMRV
ncbi:hypothetical protein [Trinickia acidisoli]|uniref:hypothetical protein n=1 Tax=Trinickia acidisoli TaxID=2767482 RepID=UPI001A8D7E27|nr:hypothetical protein [Trinickia acidisoli]